MQFLDFVYKCITYCTNCTLLHASVALPCSWLCSVRFEVRSGEPGVREFRAASADACFEALTPAVFMVPGIYKQEIGKAYHHRELRATGSWYPI